MKPFLNKIHQKRFWLFLLGIIILSALFIVTAIHATSFIGSIIWGLFFFIVGFCFIASIGLLIILTTRMIIFKVKNRTLLEISLYGILGCGFIIITQYTIGSLLIEKAIEESKKVASIIIEALEKYKNEKGKYPKELKELVPQYLTEIPKAKTKRSFFKDCNFYYSGRENYYRLKFPGYVWTFYIYSSDAKEWKVDS